MTKDYIQDLSNLHNFRTEIPNIIFSLGLDIYERSLYIHYKRVAGDKGGCWQSNKTIAEECGMSIRKLQSVKKSLCRPRKELDGLSLITVAHRKREDKGDTSDIVSIVNIWPKNAKRYYDESLNRGSAPHAPPPGRETSVPPCTPCTPPMHDMHPPGAPHAPKEDPIKEDPIEEHMSQPADAGMRLARFLFEKIKEANPKAKEPSFTQWGSDIAKIIRLDGRTEEEVESVLRWATAHDFWSARILSGAKFRKQFDQLYIQKAKEKISPIKQKEDEAKRKTDMCRENKEWAREFLKDKQFPDRDNCLELKDNGVEVKSHGSWRILGFLENGFKDQLQSLCYKLAG